MNIRYVLVASVSLLLVACGKADKPSLASLECALDTVAGANGTPATAKVGSKLSLHGWAADIAGKRVAPQIIVWVVSQDASTFKAANKAIAVARADVARHFGIAEIAGSGFQADIDTSGFKPGTYDIMIESRFENFNLACRSGKTLVLQ